MGGAGRYEASVWALSDGRIMVRFGSLGEIVFPDRHTTALMGGTVLDAVEQCRRSKGMTVRLTINGREVAFVNLDEAVQFGSLLIGVGE